jgi:hypothetical protein
LVNLIDELIPKVVEVALHLKLQLIKRWRDLLLEFQSETSFHRLATRFYVPIYGTPVP